MTKFSRWNLIVFWGFAWAASPLPADTSRQGLVDFKKEILPVIRDSCFACHVSNNAPPSVKLDAVLTTRRQKVIYDGLDSFVMGEKFPFPDERTPAKQLKKMEKLLLKDSMPPREQAQLQLGAPLSDQNRQLLVNWIEQIRPGFQP